MLNIHDLERRWLKYKIKSYLPLVLILIILLTISVSALLYFPYSSTPEPDVNVPKQENKLVKETTTPAQVVTSTTVNEQADTLPKEVIENTQDLKADDSQALVLKPSLRFMDNIEDGLNPYLEEEMIIETPEMAPLTEVDTVEEVKETSPPTEENKKSLTIIRNDDESEIKDVIRRFKKNKNPTLSLFIAKRYYALGKYQNSYNYALITNEIDKNIDESWIIFSKSLVKLGQHELAIATLKSYLKTTKSTQAEILLRKIESGDFR